VIVDGRVARRWADPQGYAMAALLVGMSVMAVFLTMAMPVWSTAAKRAREEELVFRGEQYARAIGLFQRKYANALPPNLDVLVNEKFLRKKYLDPVTGGEFQALTGAAAQAAPGLGAGAGAAPGRASTGTGQGTGTAAGLWLGLVVGLAFAAGLLMLRFWRGPWFRQLQGTESPA